MTGAALAIFDGLMLHLCGGDLFFDGVVALETEFAVGFEQQAFGIRSVRVVASQTFAVLDRLMLRFGRFGKGIMTCGAKICAGLQQHLRVRVSMRIVAGGALAILGRLMLNLEF
jgi:hypothetical protein